MSDRMKVETKGGGGNQGGRRRNNSRNNDQPNNKSNSNSCPSKLEELETATYIVIGFSLADIYEKITKEIIRYVIRKLPFGVHLARGIRDGKLPNMSLDTNPKQ